jgi:hypothetical protein
LRLVLANANVRTDLEEPGFTRLFH